MICFGGMYSEGIADFGAQYWVITTLVLDLIGLAFSLGYSNIILLPPLESITRGGTVRTSTACIFPSSRVSASVQVFGVPLVEYGGAPRGEFVGSLLD